MPIKGNEKGAVALEFAIISSLLVFMLFSFLELGLAINATQILTGAAREGARKAAIEGGADEKAFHRVEEVLASGHLDVDKTQISITPKQATYGTVITVALSYRYEFSFPPLAQLAGNGVVLRAKALARSEKVR